MSAGNLDSANLKAVAYGGVINEDVMQQIWDISNIPLPFTDRIGTADGAGNEYVEWVEEDLADPDLSNSYLDGQDTDTINDTRTGERLGNRCQISLKVVQVSTRAQQSDTIGAANELVKQVMKRQRELRRDVEAISLSNQGSRADDGNSVTGLAGGFPSFYDEATYGPGGTGAIDIPGDATAGGFATGTLTLYTPGTARGGTETMLKNVIEAIYVQGGDPTVIMSVPGAIRKLNEWMFDNSAKIATLQSDAGQSQSQMVAKGSVNVYIADHGQVLELVPNRIQQTYATVAAGTGAMVFVFDPAYVRHAHLHGYRTEPLAKTGLADKRQMAVDWSLKNLQRDAHGFLADIDPAVAWSA